MNLQKFLLRLGDRGSRPGNDWHLSSCVLTVARQMFPTHMYLLSMFYTLTLNNQDKLPDDNTEWQSFCPWVGSVILYLLISRKCQKILILIPNFASVSRIMISMKFTHSHWDKGANFELWFARSRYKATHDAIVASIYSGFIQVRQ